MFGHCFWERVVDLESKTRPMKLMNRRSKGEGGGSKIAMSSVKVWRVV